MRRIILYSGVLREMWTAIGLKGTQLGHGQVPDW